MCFFLEKVFAHFLLCYHGVSVLIRYKNKKSRENGKIDINTASFMIPNLFSNLHVIV